MIDREKVIQALEEFVGIGSPKWYPHKIDESFKDIQKLLTDALALLKEQQQQIWEFQDQVEYLTDKLKEQEAVEPIPFITTTGEESKNYVVCGHCKSIKAIMPKDTKQKYCHECGRPVLWKGR